MEGSRPLDHKVRHPFGPWAQTIGGILAVNGFKGFLGNYSLRRTVDDPVRRGLALLGAACPGKWQRSAEWAKLAVGQGLVKVVIPPADQGSDKGRERGMGVVLSAHRDETFHAETDDERLTLRLEKNRQRRDREKEPSTKYKFVVVKREPIPADDAPQVQRAEPADARRTFVRMNLAAFRN